MGRFLIGLLLLAVPLLAQQVPDSEHIFIEASARIEVPVDVAVIEANVARVDSTAVGAKDYVDHISRRVVALTEALGIAREDVDATPVVIKEDWQDRLLERYGGIEVKRRISITLRDLSKYTDLIEGLAELPISSVERVRFASSEIELHEEEALDQAIAKAKRKGEHIAEQLGAKLGDIYSFTESSVYSILDPRRESSMRFWGLDENSRFEPGTVEVGAKILVVFNLIPEH